MRTGGVITEPVASLTEERGCTLAVPAGTLDLANDFIRRARRDDGTYLFEIGAEYAKVDVGLVFPLGGRLAPAPIKRVTTPVAPKRTTPKASPAKTTKPKRTTSPRKTTKPKRAPSVPSELQDIPSC